MEEDDCCIVNPWDLKRKIFVWFCITHLMKAFRNQLYASQPGGSRGFQDKYDVPFGWGLVHDLYKKVCCMSQSSDNPHNLSQFTEAVAYP